MIVIKHFKELEAFVSVQQKNKKSIGLVPTMGSLHEGHISLITNAKENNQTVICSIFINPTQFNNAVDFQKYPTAFQKDETLLDQCNCDVLFMPSVTEIYPNGFANLPHYSLGYIETILEGKYRPGHFQGVCQIIFILLNAVNPTNLYLGQKDYQQCMVIKKLIEISHLNINVIVCPTLRETNGLAMSSRNMRLNDAERKQAVKISEVLYFIKKEIKPGFIGDLKDRAINYLTAEGFKLDYVEIADATNLNILQTWNGTSKIVALIAAYLNEVRLIDNLTLN